MVQPRGRVRTARMRHPTVASIAPYRTHGEYVTVGYGKRRLVRPRTTDRSMLDGSDGTVSASPQAQSPPAAEDVRAQLDILLASPDLDAPARARRFLRYVVEETLSGRAERIKAYAIGTEVFERNADFDA